MSQKFTFTADISEIYSRLTDPDFLVERNTSLGDIDVECETEETDSTTLVKMTRTRVKGLPTFLTNIIDTRPVLDTEETWQTVKNGYKGSSLTTIEGQPGTVSAEFSLSTTKKGCEFTVTHSAKIKIPLIGRKVEKFLVTTVGEETEKEMAYLSSALDN